MRKIQTVLLAVCLLHIVTLTAGQFVSAENEELETEISSEYHQTASVSDNNDPAGFMATAVSLLDYYNQSQIVRSSTQTAEVLAGAKAFYRRIKNEQSFRLEVETASGIGSAARQVIEANQMSYAEYETLLRIVEAEATAGDVHSKMLIACVVLNRVRDSHFPDNIIDVVWERSDDGSAQFSPTEDGRFNTVTITDGTKEAVRRVLEGEDPSEGALFFVARHSASAENVYWFDSQLEVLYAYGGHDFFTFRDYVSGDDE